LARKVAVSPQVGGNIRLIPPITKRDYWPLNLVDHTQPTRHILVADPTRPNFVTFELPPAAPGAEPVRYAVFFEVKKDSVRRRRMLLRVQSASFRDAR